MEIRPGKDAEFEAVIRVWHETKRATYRFIPQERDRSLEEDRAFFHTRIRPRCALWVAVDDDAVRGFLALDGSYVDRLYVHPGAQRRGVGGALLDRAMALRPDGIALHTHQRNLAARAFYEKRGFRAVRLGISAPPENEPDVEYHWRPGAADLTPDAIAVRRASVRGPAGTAGTPRRTPPRT
jgi:ribosomal protein S18 acetylase RimI-like enzyme